MLTEADIIQKYRELKGGLDLSSIFTILFLTIGPLKILPVFVKLTANADEQLRKQMAWRSALLATVTIIPTALLGGAIC